MTIKLRPFFCYYGSKFRDAHKYPQPQHGTIVEPFAGSAGYALRHNAERVVLCDLDSNIVSLWKYLIGASQKEILSLPDMSAHGSVDDFDLRPEEKILIGFWLGVGPKRPIKRPWAWMRTRLQGENGHSSFWGASVRESIASQLHLIRHWEIYQVSFQEAPVEESATWFIDPPYVHAGKGYRHGSSSVNFEELSEWCQSRPGQVIVCEQDGAKWLPFSHLHHARAARNSARSAEVIWTSEGGAAS